MDDPKLAYCGLEIEIIEERNRNQNVWVGICLVPDMREVIS